MIEAASEQPARHEMHTGLDDDVGAGGRGFAGELQAVAAKIADEAENVRRHVIVGEDNRVLLFLDPVDRSHERGHSGPLHRRDEIGDQRVEMVCLGLHGGVIGQAAGAGGGCAAQGRRGRAAGRGIDQTGHGFLLASRHLCSI